MAKENLLSEKLTEKKKLPPFTKKTAAGCGILAGLFIIVVIVLAIVFGKGTPIFDKVKSPTNQSPVTLSASNSYKNAKIDFYQDGTKTQELKSDNNGKFSAKVELKERNNKFKAVATNEKGKSKTSIEINIVYDKTPPTISLTQPQSPTENSKIEIQGTSEKITEIKLLKDNKEIAKLTTSDDKFTFKDIGLAEGDNKFKAVATDEAGNQNESGEMVVKYTPKKDAEAKAKAEEDAKVKADAKAKAEEDARVAAENNTDMIAHQLAVINAGTPVRDNDININRFRFLLKTIDSKTTETQQEIADQTVTGWNLMRKDFGKDVSLLEFMETANNSIPANYPGKYSDIVVSLIILIGHS